MPARRIPPSAVVDGIVHPEPTHSTGSTGRADASASVGQLLDFEADEFPGRAFGQSPHTLMLTTHVGFGSKREPEIKIQNTFFLGWLKSTACRLLLTYMDATRLMKLHSSSVPIVVVLSCA